MLINLTPHPVNVLDDKNNIIKTIDQSGIVPRLVMVDEDMPSIDGIKIVKRVYGKTKNLPEPKESTYYIVSSLILTANPNRLDLLVPNTVRDERGQIIGCDSFARN